MPVGKKIMDLSLHVKKERTECRDCQYSKHHHLLHSEYPSSSYSNMIKNFNFNFC